MNVSFCATNTAKKSGAASMRSFTGAPDTLAYFYFLARAPCVNMWGSTAFRADCDVMVTIPNYCDQSALLGQKSTRSLEIFVQNPSLLHYD